MGVRKQLSSLNFLLQPGSNWGYSPNDIIESFMVSIWCGANRFLHTVVTRHDKTLVKIFAWKTSLGNDTFKWFFKKFNIGNRSELSQYLFGWHFNNLRFNNYTLDCESIVNTCFSNQEGAMKGYNPKKPGHNSHHSIIAFIK
jgi:hypothetical protein